MNFLGTAFRITCEIVTVLLGAMFFVQMLDKTRKIEALQSWLQKFDSRVDRQALVLSRAWLSILEGISGFGSPTAIVAPLLIKMGIRLELAVLLPLLGGVFSVPFGASGIPLRIGFPEVPYERLALTTGRLLVILGWVTFFIMGWLLNKRKKITFEDVIWIARGAVGFMIGMAIAAQWVPDYSAVVAGFGALLFWVPWKSPGKVLDPKVFFLAELILFLVIGRGLFKTVQIYGYRLSNPGLWILAASVFIAYRSHRSYKMVRELFLNSLLRLKKPFLVTFGMTSFILGLSQWMQSHVAYVWLNPHELLGLGLISTFLAGTSTLGNLWVHQSFLTPNQVLGAAAAALGSAIGTLISFQILTSVMVAVGEKRIPWKIYRLNLVVAIFLLVFAELVFLFFVNV